MAELPTAIPARIVAGTSLQFTRDLPDYPASTWTLTYALVKSGQRITFSGADNGDDRHLLDVAPATTAAWAAGTYAYQAILSDGTDRITVESGTLQIVPDFAAQSSGYDGRSHARKVLDAIEAVLEGRASESDLQVQFRAADGHQRMIQKCTHEELLAFRSRYQAEAAREAAANRGETARRRLRVRF